MRKTLIVFAFVLLCSSFAGAQSTESVCDGEVGAAYGLCNAFCDAMECDTDDPQASETACNKVKSKYQQVTGNEPPCLVPVCPCIEELPGFLDAVNGSVIQCYDDGSSVSLVGVGSFTPFSIASPGPSFCGNEFGTLIEITFEQGLACNNFLRARAAAAGRTCG